jgi:hypothetical protein
MWREGLVCLCLLSGQAYGQFKLPAHEHDSLVNAAEHYRFPVNPGMPAFLAGTMGELRPTHFHGGIDIRTNNREGVPIRAAMRGYVSRVIVGTFGYGKVIFVAHPNGQTTVYGHLSAIKGKLGDYVREKQYAGKSFDVDLQLLPDQFPVAQSDTIGFSGNTGGSNGPHLHFEIRDSANNALNPMKFGFPELQDRYPPRVSKIALKTLDSHSRINDAFGRFEFYVFKSGNSYRFAQPILAKGNIGVELLAYDVVDQNNFNCGINYIEMFADSQRVFSQVIDKVNFNETRGILNVLDFKTLKTRGTYFNKLFVDDGNALDYYTGSTSRGIVRVRDHDVAVRIELRDTQGNKSKVLFSLKASPVSATAQLLPPMKKPVEADIQGNILTISTAPCPASAAKLTVISRNETREMTPDYSNGNRNVYLINLLKMLPDSVASCAGSFRFNFKDAVPSGTEYKFYDDIADIRFQDGDLYDTLFLAVARTEKEGNEVFTIGNPTVPLNQAISVTLKPITPWTPEHKPAVYRINGNQYDYLGGTFTQGRMKFRTLELGDFVLLRDTVPPAIQRIYLNRTTARFRIADRLSGIGHYEATLDGQWLLMNYDYKTGILQSEKLDRAKPLKGEFVLHVTDQAGNEKTFTQKIL